MIACPAWNLCKLESNQSLTCWTRKSISPLMCAASSDVHSQSRMDCRGVLVAQDSRNAARCTSTSVGATLSRPERAKKVAVSSPSMTRSVSRFYSEHLVREAQFLTEGNRTFKGLRSGSSSEYPVASAIGRITERVLARCSVVDSKWRVRNKRYGERKLQTRKRAPIISLWKS